MRKKLNNFFCGIQKIRGIFLIAALALPYSQSFAQDTGGLPINLTADSGESDANKGIATYTGNVVISQGEMRVSGDKVVVHIDKGQVSVIEAWGKPASFHYVPKGEPAIDGWGSYMKYSVVPSTVYMEGNAKVRQEQNETKAQTLTYDLKREKVSGKRVNMTLIPKSK